MTELIRSATFDRWLSGLRDRRAVARIAARLDRLASGNPGDAQPVVTECRNSGSTMGQAIGCISSNVARF